GVSLGGQAVEDALAALALLKAHGPNGVAGMAASSFLCAACGLTDGELALPFLRLAHLAYGYALAPQAAVVVDLPAALRLRVDDCVAFAFHDAFSWAAPA